jgi:hypothetical protein
MSKEVAFSAIHSRRSMTKKIRWGLRSMQDDPNSDLWGGQNVVTFSTPTPAYVSYPRKPQILGRDVLISYRLFPSIKHASLPELRLRPSWL